MQDTVGVIRDVSTYIFVKQNFKVLQMSINSEIFLKFILQNFPTTQCAF